MEFEKSYIVKLFSQSPFYVSIPNESVYVLCDKNEEPYAQLHTKPWFIKEGMKIGGSEIKIESYNLKSKQLEPGDIVTFKPFAYGKIKEIVLVEQDSWDWKDKFVLINCKSVSPNYEVESTQTLLRSECEHKHYKMCEINMPETKLWDLLHKEWLHFTSENLTPCSDDVIEFLKDKVDIKQE